MIKLKILSLIIISFSAQIFAQNTGDKQEKAREILLKASNAVKLKTRNSIKSLSLTFNNLSNDSKIIRNEKIESKSESLSEIYLDSPDKLKSSYKGKETNTFRGQTDFNESLIESILNGSLFSLKMEAFVEGVKVNLPLKYPTKEEGVLNLSRETFQKTFPITFDSSWFYPLDFTFVGIAQSKDGRANVIEATAPDKHTHRFFFDEKTNLLLMAIETWTTNENLAKQRKYFYSDYKEIEGLNVATKIKIEQDGNLSEERTLKTLKLNPVFKSDFFEVKNPMK